MENTENPIEYRAVNIPDDKLKAILPYGAYKTIQKKPHLIIAGRDGDKEVALMILITSANSGEAEVLHVDLLETDNEKRFKIYRELLKAGCDIAFSQGIKSIDLVWNDLPDMMINLAESLRECGFLPISLCGMLMEYSIDDAMYDRNLKKLPELKKKMNLEFTVLEKDDVRLKAVFGKSEELNASIDRNLYDKQFSRFYYKNGELKACILGIRASESMLYIPVVYADGSEAASAVLTIMLEEIIREAYAIFPVGSRFTIQSYFTVMEKGILRVFDNPLNEYQIHEYICINKNR